MIVLLLSTGLACYGSFRLYPLPQLCFCCPLSAASLCPSYAVEGSRHRRTLPSKPEAAAAAATRSSTHARRPPGEDRRWLPLSQMETAQVTRRKSSTRASVPGLRRRSEGHTATFDRGRTIRSRRGGDHQSWRRRRKQKKQRRDDKHHDEPELPQEEKRDEPPEPIDASSSLYKIRQWLEFLNGMKMRAARSHQR